MASHIEKVSAYDGKRIYYQGNLKWTENFSDRKSLQHKSRCQEEQYQFRDGGRRIMLPNQHGRKETELKKKVFSERLKTLQTTKKNNLPSCPHL